MSIDTTLPVWIYPPDWSEIVRERLEHRTDVIPAEDGSEQTRATRLTPRRSFEYLQSLVGSQRQAAANLAWGRGAGRFYLPIWTDGLTVREWGVGGRLAMTVDPLGYDFQAGQVAALMDATGRYELATVASTSVLGVLLETEPDGDWPAGSVLYPIRRAWLDDAFSQAAFKPGMGYGRIRWLIDEANPYLAIPPADSYRGFPVLEHRPAYAHDPDLGFERPLDLIDDDIGLRATYDRVGIPLYLQTHDWQLDSRAALHAFRGLVYALKGKRNSIWIPSYLDDLTPAMDIGALATTLVVDWCGYTVNIAQATNRRDLRIELTDGTVVYRRITASAETGDTEQLTLDAPLGLGRTVSAAEFRQVSFLGLCRSDSDIVELGWWTGTYADVTTAWRGRQHDV